MKIIRCRNTIDLSLLGETHIGKSFLANPIQPELSIEIMDEFITGINRLMKKYRFLPVMIYILQREKMAAMEILKFFDRN
jgi:hypothetical protein